MSYCDAPHATFRFVSFIAALSLLSYTTKVMEWCCSLEFRQQKKSADRDLELEVFFNDSMFWSRWDPSRHDVSSFPSHMSFLCGAHFTFIFIYIHSYTTGITKGKGGTRVGVFPLSLISIVLSSCCCSSSLRAPFGVLSRAIASYSYT